MGFAGNLQTLSLAEVVQTLNRIGATGVLRLASADGGRDLVFDGGQLIGIGLRSGEDRQALLRRLIAQGKVTAEDVAAISGRGGEAGATALVQAIVERGLMPAADIEAAIVEHAHDELYNLWTWDFADFVFHELDDPEVEAKGVVERHRRHPLTINLNSLLMESARRLDEWERLKERFADGGVVYGPAPGGRAGIDRAGGAYPGSAVVPLIDAVRSVDDMVRDAVATRLEVYGVLAELLDARLLRALSDEELRRHADELYGRGNNARAGELYRKLLARHPGDVDLAARLAQCLEEVGDAPEAAGCYGQLAIGYLGKDQGEAALACAHKAVELSPADPAVHNVLVRCLVELGQSTEAIERLLHLAALYRQLGRLEEARDTCLKCLAVDAACDEARRELARVFAVGGQVAGSEDQVLCVQCGEPNPRTGTACVSCAAPLHLTCLACQRVVSASDRMCIFCGCDPHGGSRRHARGTIRGPSTSQVVNPEKVRGASGAHPDIAAARSELDQHLHAARKAAQAGELAIALKEWKEVARLHPDNPEVHVHIRNLEARIHDQGIESQIERGHQYRRVRRFWRAMRCYRQALRTMASDDPRAERLGEILASTARSHQVITLIYAGAVVITLVFGFWVAKPWVDLRSFRSKAAEAGALVAEAGRVDLPTLGLADGLFAGLEADAERFAGSFRQRAQIDLLDAKGALLLARQRVAERELAAIAKLLDQGGLAEAEQKLADYRATFGGTLFAPQLQEQAARAQALRRRHDEAAADARLAPAALAKAKEHEAAGRLAAALAGYRALAETPAVAKEAHAAAALLEPRAAAFQADWTALRALAEDDVTKAAARLPSLAATATAWGLADEHAALATDLARRAAEAKAAWPAAERGDAEVLRAFLKRHRGTAEALLARRRLDQLDNQARTLEQGLKSHRELLERKAHELAFASGKALLSNFPARLKPGDVRMPLEISSLTAGARLWVDGVDTADVPHLLLYDLLKPPALEVRAGGFRPAALAGPAVTADWRWQVKLMREPRWSVKAARPVTLLQALPGGDLLAAAGEELLRFEPAGSERWRQRLVAVAGAGDGAARPLPAVDLGDGRLVVAQIDRGVLELGADGGVLARHGAPVAAGALVGAPAVFVNPLLGPQPRLAFAAPALASGPLAGPFAPRPQAGIAMAGPLVLRSDLDCALLVADANGNLVAVEDGGAGRRLWQADLAANQVGALVASGDGGVLMVLDGGRLECWDATPAGARKRWSLRLAGDPVGAPAVVAGEAWLAVGAALVRKRLDGLVLPPLPLPSPASCGVAAAGDLAAVGCRNGELVVFKKAAAAWLTPTSGPVTAVAVSAGLVSAGCADGSLLAYPP